MTNPTDTDNFDLSDFLPGDAVDAENTPADVELEKSSQNIDDDPKDLNLSAAERREIASEPYRDDGIKLDESFIVGEEQSPDRDLKNSLFFRTTVAVTIASIGAGIIWTVSGWFEPQTTARRPTYPNRWTNEERLRKLAAAGKQNESHKKRQQKTTGVKEKETINNPPTIVTPSPPKITEQPKPKEIPSYVPQQQQIAVANLPLSSHSNNPVWRSPKNQAKLSNVELDRDPLSLNVRRSKSPSSIELLRGDRKINKHLVRAGTKISGTIIAPVHYIEALAGSNLVVSLDTPLRDKKERIVMPVGSRLVLKVIINDNDVFATQIFDSNSAQPILLKSRATLTRADNDRPIVATTLNGRQTSLFFNKLLSIGLQTGNSFINSNNSNEFSYYERPDPMNAGLETLSRSLLNLSEENQQQLNYQNLESKKVYLIPGTTKINIYFLNSFLVEKSE